MKSATKTDHRSADAQAYRAWYRLAVWCAPRKGLRWQCLFKARFTCAACGFRANPSETHKLVADHIVPHRGDWDRFANPNNLQCLCQQCHSKTKQQDEAVGYTIAVGEDGWPLDIKHPANR